MSKVAPAKIKIELYLDGDGWMSQDDNPETFDLFGTNILPLPFLKNTPASSVLSVIKKLNPDAIVTLR